jgi:hypothetical protein
MTVVARIDSLIANLQGLKQAVAAERGTGFEVALNAALDEADAVVGGMTAAPAPAPIAMTSPAEMALASRTGTSFDAFLQRDLLTTAEAARAARPTDLPAFMARTGASFEDSVEIIYGVIGSNQDLRNWEAIMASDNPIDAARAATRQLYNSDRNYQLGQHADHGTARFADTLAAHSLQPDTTIARGGNFAVHGTPDEARPGNFSTTSLMAVSSTGLLLRGAGSTKDQIERTAWLFGFDTSRIAGMAAQTRAHDARLADTLSQFG